MTTPEFPLFPTQASTYAAREDALFFFLLAVSAFFAALIFFLVIFFAVRYRRRSPTERASVIREPLALELAWTIIPLGINIIAFVWGAQLFFFASRPPTASIEIAVVGKQWMWKFQHPEGRSEINELHVPEGRPIKLTMTSQDAIHSFFVPAFRVKKDVVPGRYTVTWFEATRIGDYHLFCSQYCGALHAHMIGRVTVMNPVAYEQWLGGVTTRVSSMAEAGRLLFRQRGCPSCHRPDGKGLGPSLVGLFGQPVYLQDGRSVIADEGYIRESVLLPQAKIVAGYAPIMPSFKGQISEEELLQIIAYIKSLKQEQRTKGER
ncbi:MAG: cytochrome c oxidase subunit II [Candidatus Methylomirabilota bacterium]|nr:MAG: cytochrome c oxidase subunit II [candidate division NC10 bacterium]